MPTAAPLPASDRGHRRILQVTALPFPPEIRVVKECLTLAGAGYRVAVLCPPVAGRPEHEVWRDIEVFRPQGLRSMARVWDKGLYHTAFFSPSWWRAIREVLRAFEPQVVHVHDIWLGRSVLAARSTQRLVMDLHENMPAAVVEYQGAYTGARKLVNGMFKGYGRILKYERALLQRSDLVMAVVEEARNRILSTHPRLDPRRVVNVENLESREFIGEAVQAPAEATPGEFSILYIGGFGPHRGIDTLIHAMVHLKSWEVPAKLRLVGARDGSPYVGMLRELIAKLEVESHVEVTGWVPAEAVLGYISGASVGAVPHHSNPHTDTTIPHKLYQYMIAGKPVIVSSSAPLARTVRAAGAGAVFAAGDALDCATKLRELMEDAPARARYAAAGREYVLRQGHNWEDESAPRLLAAYDGLFAEIG